MAAFSTRATAGHAGGRLAPPDAGSTVQGTRRCAPPRIEREGFVEGRNVAIEQRWADNQRDRLPALAADLVRRRVAVIVGSGGTIRVARAATSTIPLIFVSPTVGRLVASLNRPEGNIAGVTFYGGHALNAKQLEMMQITSS